MDERIRSVLEATTISLSLDTAMPPSRIEEVFNFNAREMEVVPSEKLSEYTIMLAQYLITLQARFNTARVIARQQKKVLDRKAYLAIKAEGNYKGTLKERESNIIVENEDLRKLSEDYEEAAAERDLIEGMDKPITELINALKSELRRRQDERQYINRERST